ELSKSIEKIEKTLRDLYEKEKKPESESEDKSENEDQEGQEEQDKSGGDKEQGDTGDKKESSKSEKKLQIDLKPEELGKYEEEIEEIEDEKKKEKEKKEKLKTYESLKEDVAELHNLWNSTEPKLIKNLTPQLSIDNFENALNYFTNDIETQNTYANLVSLIELYRYLPDFSESYKTKYPPDIDRLKFAVKKASLISDKDDFDNLKATLKYLTERWEKTKPKLKKESTDNINKFDLALSDFKASIDSKDKNIIKVKSGVLLSIIDGLIEESKQDDKKE
ncbi:MAG: hypothetical protein GX154_13065, partial [Clostridiales bacterium]|nr:hypothetical protein [Clostridiales bacterium]